MAMRRAQIVKKDMSRRWLIGTGCSQGKLKDYTSGTSRKHSRRREKVGQKMGVIEGGEETNGTRRQLAG